RPSLRSILFPYTTLFRSFVETDRVRRQGDIGPRLQCGDSGDDLVDVLAGQRLTAGETDLIDTELLNGDAHEAHDLVTGHRGIPGHELDARSEEHTSELQS